MAEFIEERRPQLLAFIERKLGPALRRKLEVEDVFQEVSVDCVSALAEVGLGTPGGATRDGGLINLLVASMASPSQAFSRQQRVEEIDALPPDQSEAIRLRYVEEMPTKEIAKLLSKTDGAVRVMLTRTLKQLASRLGSDMPPL